MRRTDEETDDGSVEESEPLQNGGAVSHNTDSCRVPEKAGFQLEGLLRKNAVKNGEIMDMKLYALVRTV